MNPHIDAARLLGQISEACDTLAALRPAPYNAAVSRRSLSPERCAEVVELQERATAQLIRIMTDLRSAMRVAGDDRIAER